MVCHLAYGKSTIIELLTRDASAHSQFTRQVVRDYDLELLELFHEIANRASSIQKCRRCRNTHGELLYRVTWYSNLDATPKPVLMR